TVSPCECQCHLVSVTLCTPLDAHLMFLSKSVSPPGEPRCLRSQRCLLASLSPWPIPASGVRVRPRCQPELRLECFGKGCPPVPYNGYSRARASQSARLTFSAGTDCSSRLAGHN